MCCTLTDTIISRYKKKGDTMLLLLYFYMLTFIDVFMVSAMMFTTNYLRYTTLYLKSVAPLFINYKIK